MSHKGKYNNIKVNGFAIDIVVRQLMEVSAQYDSVKITDKVISELGFNILSDFCRAMNMVPVITIVDKKKK